MCTSTENTINLIPPQTAEKSCVRHPIMQLRANTRGIIVLILFELSPAALRSFGRTHFI